MYYLLFGIFLSLLLIQTNAELRQLRNSHVPRTLTDAQLNYVAGLSNVTNINEILDNICIPRVVGSPGHDKVHDYIVSQMTDLGWDIEVDSFTDKTPNFGTLKFRNIVATKNLEAERFLVLACHYDSKYFKDFEFLGATDSAVPCAMIINLAHVMKKELEQNTGNVGLKLFFFDGEEAFHQWGPADSIYGARHLAAKYETQQERTRSGNKVTHLDRIDLLVLLDLLGSPHPQFYSYFTETNKWYFQLLNAEKRLNKLGIFKRHTNYFQEALLHSYTEDDHIPFLKRGVPILHLIPHPFPQVWHTIKDDMTAISIKTTENLNKILRVFTAEYLHLVKDEDIPDDEDDNLHIEL